mmetsp:Transcript_7652/g.14591  ORF Transcript_7652/g.14591 Transcript_7652/m.14591 type:complete len:1365 (+) Transcript_7652:217-4311(+)
MTTKFIKKVFKKKKSDPVSGTSTPSGPSPASSTANIEETVRSSGSLHHDVTSNGDPVADASVSDPKQARLSSNAATPIVAGADAGADPEASKLAATGSIFASKKRGEIPAGTTRNDISPQKPSAAPAAAPVGASTRRLSQPEGVVFDHPSIDKAYENIPLLDMIELPRGGFSVETQAVGHVQFGIPPETIKDSMRLGIAVPSVYIVPVDRFCREMGPALGVNLAEFEFPAYFNFFVQRKRCTLIVDSVDAERNIRRVFSETLLGPAQFRHEENPLTHEDEDFAPDFPREAIPDFQKELKHFRIMPNGSELVLETLLKFCHFESAPDSNFRDNLGAPPVLEEEGVEVRVNGAEDLPGEEVTNENGTKKGKSKTLSYSQIRWIGDVAKVYPSDAPEDQIKQNKTKRVEIFKMPSGTDYVVHDIDENNIIVGKARFSGNVRVSEGISVIGLDEDKSSGTDNESDHPTVNPPTFHPPSFGLTVLGNSHGFDKSGSTSGYVLWINGRGVMIDPPPYSSATLEREGIRPRLIVGIILTHCHADHDAGAFQKVLTGSPVIVITTPTIYKSFIRKYAALSSLSPALLRHSHRYKPAIIGEPLRFQGATFHFTYTLHSIPCVGFRVDWRGRSMVFTGDHFNNPPAIQKLVEKGVLSPARAADLSNLPLQETDLLLHEAGAPPIHTPLDVLLKLPEKVKQRLYVVHTSALPENCPLRVAPTGTAGTIRLDRIRRSSAYSGGDAVSQRKRPSIFDATSNTKALLHGSVAEALLEDVDEYAESELFTPSSHIVYAHLRGVDPLARPQRSEPPPVSMRPTSSSDAWFILNLLSAVPFLSSLSYTSTMEVLETARVAAYCCGEVVVPANRRGDFLVVVWEGTCMEREVKSMDLSELKNGEESQTTRSLDDSGKRAKGGAIWHAGDWTGPRALQPEKRLSGDNSSSLTNDVVAMSEEGVKVIVVDYSSLKTILKNGSALYRRYVLSRSQKHACVIPPSIQGKISGMFENAVKNLNVIELLDSNTGLRKLTAVQKRHLECLVEGPTAFAPGQRLWRSGSAVDKAFIVVAGTVSFVPKRRNGGTAGKVTKKKTSRVKEMHETKTKRTYEEERPDIGESMQKDAVRAVREIHARRHSLDDDHSSIPGSDSEDNNESLDKKGFSTTENNSLTETEDYARLSRGLRKWAERHEGHNTPREKRRGSSSTDASPEVSLHDFCDAVTVQEDDAEKKEQEEKKKQKSDQNNVTDLRRETKDRFANKVLGRLYNRRAFASGLVFSRGHFLGDIEKMVEGLLSSTHEGDFMQGNDDALGQFGFGDNDDALSLDTMTIHEQEGAEHTVHSSTLAAGKDGCVVLVFPKASLIPFLDAHPGLLLSLLGTQVVV